jgi:hypothetical protein
MVDADNVTPAAVNDGWPRPWRARNLVLGALLVALVGVLASSGPPVLRIIQQRDTTITTPAQVAGLRLDQRDDAKQTAEYVRDAVATAATLTTSVGAVYADQNAATRSVIFVGGTALIWSPERALDDLFKLVSDDTGGVRDVHDVQPGSLGGLMRCGITVTQDGDMPVCGWADHGCVAVALFPNRGVDEAERLLREMRTAIQHRN